MKKLFKTIFILFFLALLTFTLIFHKRIMLCYNIVEKYISVKDEVSNMKTVDISPISDSITYKDIVYKNTNNKSLTLDIYSPNKEVYKKSPVILYVHGGSWVYGDKTIPNAISPILDTFRDEGYTIISTSYELMKNKENFAKQIADVKDTVRWIYKNSSTYNLDTDEIGIIGFSSGAHLSLMASYTSDTDFTDDESLKNYPSKVKYVIDFAGPTDLSLLNTNNLNFDLNKIFSSVTNKDSTIDKFNPINYVTPDDPNTLIIHSKSDSLVPYESSEKLYSKTEQTKANSKLITLQNSDHDLSNISTEDVLEMSKGLFIFVLLNSPL